ncbi:MAG: pentapeptide repeat-containing protein [Symploca sp. SIO1A3]|nr:pentapeptide repeat-containing protein [Symploca sp. SIO1A3]
MSLVLILKREDWLTSALASVVIAGWLLTAVTQKQIPGVSVVVIGLSAVTHWWEPVPFSLDKVLQIILTTLVVWAAIVVIFYLICFFIAALDILFERPLIVRILIACSILLGTISGTTITLLFETTEVPLIAKIVAILSSTGFGLALMLSGWWLNHRQNIPWKHPDPLRTLVLTVGSWRGTSFHNLDLSGVSFKRAKLANSNLQAKKFYRTCFQKATGLERARVDSQYLDLENLKVQKLLTDASSQDQDFRGLNLRGAYLQRADMRGFDLTDTNLTDADLKGADLSESILIRTQLAGADFQRVDLSHNILIDANLTEADLRQANLRDCILVRAQVARADFSGAIMTGICIEDWSVSSKTRFADVRCDYIYRRYQDQQPTDRYPVDRNFERDEFASQFQQPENELELVFKGEFNYRALSLTFDQLQTDKPDLNLKLQGIEQRNDLWVVKITSENPTTVETRIKEIQDAVYQGYEVTTTRLENDPLIRRIISDIANIRKTQEEFIEEIEQLQRIGSNFYFLGGTITNVTGAGEIQYTEASNQIRHLVTSGGHETQAANTLLTKLASSNVATTANEQTELIEFVIVEDAERDPQFKQFLLQKGQQIIDVMPNSAIASAIQAAIARLK